MRDQSQKGKIGVCKEKISTHTWKDLQKFIDAFKLYSNTSPGQIDKYVDRQIPNGQANVEYLAR